MKVSICIHSYNRPKVKTLDWCPDAKVFVDESEAAAYENENPGANIISLRKGIQGNVSRVRNHILRSEFEAGVDVVTIMDDDLSGLFFYESEEGSLFGYNKHRVIDVYGFIAKYSQMCQDIGFYLWGINVNSDAMAYTQGSPFSTTSVILGPFSNHMKGTECFYDERFLIKEDYDIALQHLLKYRGILRINKFHYLCKQSIQPGGCATQRNMKKEAQEFDRFQKKWGSVIVKSDQKSVQKFDYNPIVRAPIRGI